MLPFNRFINFEIFPDLPTVGIAIHIFKKGDYEDVYNCRSSISIIPIFFTSIVGDFGKRYCLTLTICDLSKGVDWGSHKRLLHKMNRFLRGLFWSQLFFNLYHWYTHLQLQKSVLYDDVTSLITQGKNINETFQSTELCET